MRLVTPDPSCQVAKFHGWRLYAMPDDGQKTFLWRWFKLLAPLDTPKRRGRKRSFVLSWSPLEERFARGADVAAMLEQQPDLAALVELYLSLNFGPSDLALYSADEIAAEKARLRAARRAWKAERAAAR